jgi:hypothetical protein
MGAFETSSFKVLQQSWYEKLAKKGFHDIERPDGTLDDKELRATRLRWSQAKLEAIADYYRLAAQYLWEGKFKPRERTVWKLHAEGMTVRAIADKTGMHRSAVHRCIKRHRVRAGLEVVR